MAALQEAADSVTLLANLSDNLQLVLDNLNADTAGRETNSSFVLQEFWNKLGSVIKALSAEATKLCLAFSQPPAPSAKECRPLVEGLERTVLALVSMYYCLPNTQGVTLQKSTCTTLEGIVDAVKTLVDKIHHEGAQGSKSQLQSTGNVWENCDAFPSWPRDNKAATLAFGKTTADLVKDALSELEEAIKDDRESLEIDADDNIADCEDENGGGDWDEPKWTVEDRLLLPPGVGLLKVARACMKKLQGAIKANAKCESTEQIGQLDSLVADTERLSPAVDDFALSLYPPMDRGNACTNAASLAQLLIHIMTAFRVSHIAMETDEQWVELLIKTTHHNLSKLDSEAGTSS